MNSYEYLCNLAQARRELNAESTADNEHLLSLIPPVSKALDLECDEEFEPIHETRTVYPSITTVSADYGTLTMVDPETKRPMRLLELEAVTNGTHALQVGTDVALYSSEPSRKLQLLKAHLAWSRRNMAHNSAFCSGSTRTRYSVSITGWWGFRERYTTEGWFLADTLHADVDASDGSIVLNTGVDQPGVDGVAPRFSPGTLCKIDDELLRVVATDEDTETLTCYRGQRGTTAAEHDAGASIYIWSVQPEFVRAAQRWVSLLYGRRGVFGTAEISDMGYIKLPTDMPEDVANIIWRFRK